MFKIQNPWKKPADPTVQQILEKQLYDAELALLAAEKEFEHAKHSKAMHQERVARLRSQMREIDVYQPGIPQILKK